MKQEEDSNEQTIQVEKDYTEDIKEEDDIKEEIVIQEDEIIEEK